MKIALKAIQTAALLAATLLEGTSQPATADSNTLSVCLNEDLPPLSVHHRGKPGGGFDVDLAEAVAKELGRPGFNGSKASSTRIPARRWKRMPCFRTVVARCSAAMPSPTTRWWCRA